MMIRKKIKEWRVKLDKKSISTEMLIKQIQFAEMPQLSTNWKRRFYKWYRYYRNYLFNL